MKQCVHHLEDQSSSAFGDIILHHLIQKKITSRKFALEIGIDPSILSRTINGTTPDYKNLLLICDGLSLNIEWAVRKLAK